MDDLFSHLFREGQKVRFTKKALCNMQFPAQEGVFVIKKTEKHSYHWDHGKLITLEGIRW